MNEQQQPVEGGSAEAHVPLLSVTVLNYNYAHYLPECLESILRQTFTDFELLLINDCSTDNSLDVIQPYLADPRVRLINHEQNKGYIASLIEGSDCSRGTYLTVISADDFCVSDRAFETLLGPLQTHDDVAYAFSAFGLYDGESRRFFLQRRYGTSFVRDGVDQFRDLLMMGNFILHSGVIIRRSAYQAVGGYDAGVRYAGDTIMWLMLCREGRVAYATDELYAWRQHGSNMSVSYRALRQSIAECMYGIHMAYGALRGRPGITHGLYVRGLKRNLSIFAESAIFADNRRGAAYAYASAVQMHPLLTIFQARTVIICARALLGANGYQSLRGALRPLRQRVMPAALRESLS
ncbi:MAG TPA: glycosyltransferase family 2 protein [Ktedonobacterales bacterium]|nr:glycosyltransferase family 2 protein [Ktedonobacterales bacterium]